MKPGEFRTLIGTDWKKALAVSRKRREAASQRLPFATVCPVCGCQGVAIRSPGGLIIDHPKRDQKCWAPTSILP